jgi:hypothetical protein
LVETRDIHNLSRGKSGVDGRPGKSEKGTAGDSLSDRREKKNEYTGGKNAVDQEGGEQEIAGEGIDGGDQIELEGTPNLVGEGTGKGLPVHEEAPLGEASAVAEAVADGGPRHLVPVGCEKTVPSRSEKPE